MLLHEADFWSFSLEFYGRNGVTSACLTLQDELGVNVNLLLLLCWCEQHDWQLDGEQIELLSLSLAQWHRDYTQPLRQIRRQLALEDQATTQVKQAIFEAEMALEKTEQRLLMGVFNQFKLPRVDSAQNLPRYIASADKNAVITHGMLIDQLRAAKG